LTRESTSLALLPARRQERRLALAVVVVSCLVFAAIAPFARQPLTPVPAFLPIYQSALVVSDLITAVLILGQFRILQSRALLVLAGAYLFSALMAVSHTLSFPGLFAPGGLMGAGPQTTAWIYFLWHAAFPLLIIIYSQISAKERVARVAPTRMAPAIFAVVGVALAGAVALTLLTTLGHDLLPPLKNGDVDAPPKVYVAAATWVLTLVAIPVLWWRQRPLTVLNLWLVVVMCAWVFDIALASVLNGGRYAVGWYAGRVYGLVAGSFVLVMLLAENSRLYAELASSRESDSRHAAELAAVLNTVVDGIITTDERGIITNLNPAAVGIFGYEPNEVIGRHMDMLLPAERREQNQQPRILSAGYEGIGKRKDGRTFPMSLATNEMRVGETRHFVGTVRDITEQKEAEAAVMAAKEEADLANKAKSTFLATMSHEIRTPMNGVLAMVELVSLTDLERDQRTMIEVVRDSGRSLLRIIDDILDFSKIEAGKLELRAEVTSVANEIESAHNLFAGSASSRGLFLKHGTDPRISPAVTVDALRLRQILHNLLSNAIKFSSAGGVVELRADLVECNNERDRVRFSVKDSGVGISPEQQSRLFQPFHQANASGTRHIAGTGLGLNISRRLAEMMGGAIEMISAPGKGTEMILTLPLPIADPAQLGDRAKAMSPAAAVVANRREAPSVSEAEREATLVLLAEDQPINRMVMIRQLNTLGYAVEPANDGLEALEMWKSGRFAIVITDCHMPRMDGYELARNIRAIESQRGEGHIPIVACTANALAGEAANCFAAGMDDYLAKPIELARLRDKLDRWLPVPPAQVPDDGHQGMNGTAVLDRTVLAELSGGDPEAERAILADFRRYNAEDRDALIDAVEKRKLDVVIRSSHRIKGACSSLGAMRLSLACERLEAAGHARDWAGIEANMQEFRREFGLLDNQINRGAQ
jgi:PAS domain S-box-containing protein